MRRIDGTRANTIDALWAQPASQVTMEQHNEFYRFIANAFDTPRYHFQVRETQSTKPQPSQGTDAAPIPFVTAPVPLALPPTQHCSRLA